VSLAAALLALVLLAEGGPGQLQVTVDSARHEVLVVAGPFRVPAMAPMPGHQMMDHAMAQDTPLERFGWPVDGWARGFRVRLVDAEGRDVPRRVLHHLIVVNFGRRQLLYPAYERLFGAGAETDDVVLPKTVGVPLQAGMPLGMYLGWHNETGAEFPGVYLRLTLLWTPSNQVPAPVSALPFYADVNLQIGGSNTFDVPPGRSTRSWEFSLPVSGRLIGLGGHLHDYGEELRLEEASTGKTLSRLRARRDSLGQVRGVERHLYGVAGEGRRLRAGVRYRVVGVYRNPTDESRLRGAMAHVAGLFVPSDLRCWPRLDEDAPDLRRDRAALDGGSEAADSAPHVHHGP
jgi:hypothetical protein